MNTIRKLFFIWELPQLLLAVSILFIVKKKITSLQRYKETLIYYVKGFPGGISLSLIIFLNDRFINDPIIIKHEYGHSRQSLLLGWIYLPLVGVPSLIRALFWKIRKFKSEDYYKKFPENWADRLGR